MKCGDFVFTVTAKIKISPSLSQQQLLSDTMNSYTAACNFVSAYIFQSHDLVQASVNRVVYYDIRNDFNLRSQMAQSVQKTVIARYKTIQETTNKWIQPRFNKPQYDLVWNRDYSLIDGMFSVNTLQGRIKVNFNSEGTEHFFDGSW